MTNLLYYANYAKYLSAQLGFDLTAGRLDVSTHPFITTVGDNDARLTTRYQKHWLPTSIFAVLHEGGHGIYEQALTRLKLPATIAQVPSLGLHESQSRMHENIIGKSLAFWQAQFKSLQEYFPHNLSQVSVAEFYRAINTAQPSLIRVEADELTYNLHIGLRFEIERDLINGRTSASDLPDIWREKSLAWLGIEPPNDRQGCLQDVHWSMGSFGYFPTYMLGNIYSAQIVQAAQKTIPNYTNEIASGNLAPLHSWLDQNIYCHGRAYTAQELIKKVTGDSILAAPLVNYLEDKFG